MIWLIVYMYGFVLKSYVLDHRQEAINGVRLSLARKVFMVQNNILCPCGFNQVRFYFHILMYILFNSYIYATIVDISFTFTNVSTLYNLYFVCFSVYLILRLVLLVQGYASLFVCVTRRRI